MKLKKSYLNKKYNLEKSNVLIYFPNLSFLRANETRKFKRSCVLKNVKLIFLPSKFKYSTYKKGHGPSIMCLLFKNLGFTEISLVRDLQNCTLSSLTRKINYAPQEKEVVSQKEYTQTFVCLLINTPGLVK